MNLARLRESLRCWLDEDLGHGDVTTLACLPYLGTVCEADFIAEEAGVLAGCHAVMILFEDTDALQVEAHKADGDEIKPGDVIMSVSGLAVSLLARERLALNLLQQLSGVATLTAKYVAAIGDREVNILDTRKTVPGFRALQKHAVACGGGMNHRHGLYDGILIKDNHIALAGSLFSAVARAQAYGSHLLQIEVECETLDQVQEALDARADVILLDNMSVSKLRRAVKLIDGQCYVEASGGITLENVAAVAKTGVNGISIGALTHSAPALSIKMEIRPVDQLAGYELLSDEELLEELVKQIPDDDDEDGDEDGGPRPSGGFSPEIV